MPPWRPGLFPSLVSCLLLASAPGVVSAQTHRAVICVDHEKRKTALSREDSITGCRDAVEGKGLLQTGDEVRVDTGRWLGVRVIRTNTALFDFDVADERIAAKDKEILQSFFKALGPYLTDVERSAARGLRGPLRSPGEILLAALEDLDRALDLLRRVEAERILGLPAVAESPAAGGSRLLRTLVELSAVDVGPVAPWLGEDHCCPRWPDLQLSALSSSGPGSLAAIYRRIIEAYGRQPDTTDRQLIEGARKALDEQGEVMDNAGALEALVRQAVNASDQWCWQGPKIQSSHGHKVTIKLSLPARLEAQHLAQQDPYDIALEVQPSWVLRPAIGLSLLYSKKSDFPTFGARELADGTFVPAATGHQDARLSYGLTLGLTWRSLERRLKGGWAVWIPELILSPSDDSRALGVGGAISWKILKLGVGGVWTKHTVLDGQVADVTSLASEGELKTRSSYASPHWYVSISVIGWQPFVSE
jgi:hypothetical protein